MRSTLKIMHDFQDARPGLRGLFRSRDAQDTFELRVTDHQATWFFTRRDFDELFPDIMAARVSWCVVDD